MSKTSTGGLGASASRGALFTITGQVGRILIQLLSVTILARLLTPEDYGLVAMVTAVIGVGEVFRDFGLSSAAIQAKTLSTGERNNLFWLNTGIGAMLSLIVFASAVPLSQFYSEPSVIPLCQVLASTFLINGLSTQYRASLTRNLQFWQLSTAEIVGQTAGLVAGVLVAVGGGGFWALAAMQIAQAVVSLLMSALFCRWIPGWYQRSYSVRPFVNFGGFLVASQLLTYASRNVDSIVIGSRLGTEPLGIYNRAFQLLVLPLNQINAPSTRVALPTLSKLHSEKERYARFVLAGQTVMLHLVSAIFAYAAALATPLVAVVLGPQWGSVVPIFQILAVAGVFQAASYATYWVFLSKGLTKSQLIYALVTRPIFIGLVLVGAIWGVTGVAIAYSAATVLIWPVGLIWIRRTGAPALGMFFNGVRAAISYGFAGTVAFTTLYLLGIDETWLQLIAGTGVFIVALAILALAWPRYRKDLATIIQTISLIRGTRKKK